MGISIYYQNKQQMKYCTIKAPSQEDLQIQSEPLSSILPDNGLGSFVDFINFLSQMVPEQQIQNPLLGVNENGQLIIYDDEGGHQSHQQDINLLNLASYRQDLSEAIKFYQNRQLAQIIKQKNTFDRMQDILFSSFQRKTLSINSQLKQQNIPSVGQIRHPN